MRKRRGPFTTGVLAAVITAAGIALAANAAAPVVIFRCTAPNGAVALQDDPCPKGHREERREMAAYAARPATGHGAVATDASEPSAASAEQAPAVEPVAMISAGETPTAPARPVLMPPPLFRCTGLSGESRLAEAHDPRPRCVPLSVLGVDLSRAPPSAAGLCRWVEDDCIELGGDAACAAWEERLAAAESALRHAFSDTMAERRRERDRARAVVENDCRP